MLEELWTEVHDSVQKAVIKTAKKKKCQEANSVSEKGLKIAVKRREAKGKRKIHPPEYRVPKNSKER